MKLSEMTLSKKAQKAISGIELYGLLFYEGDFLTLPPGRTEKQAIKEARESNDFEDDPKMRTKVARVRVEILEWIDEPIGRPAHKNGGPQ